MSDPFQKVQAGQKLEIQAETFNAFIDAALALKAQQRNIGRQVTPIHRSSGIVRVRNDSGANRERFDVLGLDAPIIEPEYNFQAFQQEPTFIGVVPSLSQHVSRFCILLEPLPAGQIGRAMISGITVARIDIVNASHGFAEIIDGDCSRLRSAPCGGAQILWRYDDVGPDLPAIVRIGTPALMCRFELKENLVPGGYAQAYLLDYVGEYQPDLDVEITVYDTLSTRRGRAANYPYFAGSAGYARFWHDSWRWEIVEMQPMAMLLQGQVDQSSGVEPQDPDFAVDNVTLMQPIGGLLNETPSLVRNRFEQKLKDDQRVLIFWNEAESAWDAFSPSIKATGIQWAKVSSSFENASGAESHTVTCTKCNWDGTGEGDEVELKTPLRANMDTALFSGYVVGYQEEPDGTKLIVTDIWDAPIGSVRAWDSTEAIRDGWEEITEAAGRFLVGCEADEEWDEPGDTGGADLNDLAAHKHEDHPATEENCIGDGIAWRLHTRLNGSTWPPELDHSVEDVSPPWYAVKWIKRTS